MRTENNQPRKPTPQQIRCEKIWLTTAEFREYVGFGSDDKQREWRDSGLLPYYAVGNTIIYKTSEVDQFVERHKMKLPWLP